MLYIPVEDEQSNINPSKEYEGGRCARKILRIKLQRDVNTYMYRAYPLCILQGWGDTYENWYHENMIQICAQIYNADYVMMDYMEECDYHDSVIESESIGYKKMDRVENIVEFIINKIDAGWYMCINLDEYYLKNCQGYMKYHFVHDTYIHGYDNIQRKFCGLGFNDNNMFSITHLEYGDVEAAFENGKIHYKESAPHAENSAVTVYKPRKYDYYHFKLIKFLGQLNNYLNSWGSRLNVSYIQPPNAIGQRYEDVRLKYGIEAMKEVLDRLKRIQSGEILIDYRAIHFLAEHKRGMLKKLRFMAKYFAREHELSELIARYSHIAENFNAIRIKSLEMLSTDDENIRARDLSEIIETFTQNMDNEVKILRKIYNFYYNDKLLKHSALE